MTNKILSQYKNEKNMEGVGNDNTKIFKQYRKSSNGGEQNPFEKRHQRPEQ